MMPGIANVAIRRTVGSDNLFLDMIDRGPSHQLASAVFPMYPPQRRGSRPRTSGTLPHIQLDQSAPAEIIKQLLEQTLRLPHVRMQQSRMAAPETRAVTLSDEHAHGPAEAFIDDHEFCHLHPAPEGSVHLSLPESLRSRAFESGWAEPHPSVRGGFVPATLVMVYAPRDEQELEIVVGLVTAAYHFAQGTLAAGWASSGERTIR